MGYDVTYVILHMGLFARKSVFRASDKASFKPFSTASETSQQVQISPVVVLTSDTFQKAINKDAD